MKSKEDNRFRFLDVFDTSSLGVLATLHDGSIIYANNAAESMLVNTFSAPSRNIATIIPSYASHIVRLDQEHLVSFRVSIQINNEAHDCDISASKLAIEQDSQPIYLITINTLMEVDCQNDISASYIRLKTLISSIHSGILVEDEQRRIVLVNEYFCHLFSINIPPESLVGFDCSDSAEASKALFQNPEQFVKDIEATLGDNVPVLNHYLTMVNGIELERDYLPIFIDGIYKGHLWVYRNITVREHTSRLLERQTTILNGVARASNILITAAATKFDQAVNHALEQIGEATGIDRVYIFETHKNKSTGKLHISQRFEWAKKGISKQINNPDLQNFPLEEELPRLLELLRQGISVSGEAKNFDSPVRELLENQQIKSVLFTPIIINGEPWGFVGFDDCTKGMQFTPDEEAILRVLAGSFGGAIANKEYNRKLTKMNKHLKESIATQKQLTQQANQAAKIKSDFLATMSHEIRTPMNGVIGMTSLLQRTPLNDEQKDIVNTIRHSGDSLLSIINDILDFSKIESGMMELEQHPFDLRLCLDEVLDMFALEANRKALDIFYTLPPTLRTKVIGDVTRIRQVLVNLVGNALKFTESGHILIGVHLFPCFAKPQSVLLRFEVVDTGIGIAPDKMELLFKPFSQVNASINRKFGGTGLGLAITSRIVSIMGGTLEVASKEGIGSTFHFTIPLQAVDEPDITVQYSHLNGINVYCKVNNPLTYASIRTIVSAMGLTWNTSPQQADVLFTDEISLQCPIKKRIFCGKEEQLSEKDVFDAIVSPPYRFSSVANSIVKALATNGQEVKVDESQEVRNSVTPIPITILVAEDNTINQKLIRKALSYLGYACDIAANGIEVLEALTRLQYDLIFMDVQMPEMDGLEATKHIIAKYGANRPPIVAMTAGAFAEDRETCLAAGMDDYVTKPVKLEDIVGVITKWGRQS